LFSTSQGTRESLKSRTAICEKRIGGRMPFKVDHERHINEGRRTDMKRTRTYKGLSSLFVSAIQSQNVEGHSSIAHGKEKAKKMSPQSGKGLF
jgi:hypothetical protein